MTTMTTPAVDNVESVPPASLPPAERDDKMPSGIPYIIANEFAERFCYYGINAILSIYMTQYLRLGEAEATTFHSLFKSGAYFFPIVGAIVSDVFWGKFRTIITFSLAYAAGCTILATGAGRRRPRARPLPHGVRHRRNQAVRLGQRRRSVHRQEPAPHRARVQLVLLRRSTPARRSQSTSARSSSRSYGRFFAFGMPAAAMLVATVAFWAGRKKFTRRPAGGQDNG